MNETHRTQRSFGVHRGQGHTLHSTSRAAQQWAGRCCLPCPEHQRPAMACPHQAGNSAWGHVALSGSGVPRVLKVLISVMSNSL